MKPLISALLALTLASSSTLSAWAAGARYRIEVAGLACPFCAYGIEKQLYRVAGVENAETHIREGAVIVTMREGAVLDEDAARKAVEDAGFTFNGLEALHADR